MSYYGTLTVGELKAYGQQVAAKYQVPWPIFDAMIQLESGWSTSSSEVSSAGAQGIAQIMPGTAADWHVNPWDPYAALDAAAMHLSEYYTQFGNSWSNALAAYNGGASPGGMAAAYRGGYPAKVLGIAKTLGGDIGSALQSGANAATTSSALSSSSNPLGSATAATGDSPGSFLQSIHDLPFGIGPGVESIVSAGIVLSISLALLAIGGIWLVMGNQATRSVAVNTAKTATKAAAVAA
jgi:Transglycosylase SLT domain